MTYSIPDEVIRETVRCPRQFFCLRAEEHGGGGMCEVRYAVGKNVLFLKDAELIACPYRVLFGYSYICSCPTHFAIFQKYHR
ncbi:MAG: hypothetical protein SWH78_11090 [Thermodesulfobacteriota bacterium]|nr:hypothetical protein [Thermodesulfobacteriota bacterium]